MSILIRDMKMPPACNRCWNCDIYTVDGTKTEPSYACLIRMKFVEEEWEHKRPKWCPLVPVPPHGRLIDADVLKSHCQQEIQKAIEWEEQEEDEEEKHIAQAIRACHIWEIHEMNHLPTIIEAEAET